MHEDARVGSCGGQRLHDQRSTPEVQIHDSESSALLACVLIASSVMTTATARVTAQEGAVTRPDLSGRWQLNRVKVGWL